VGQPQRQGNQEQSEDKRGHDGQAQAAQAMMQLRP
jgi:hypothetical protein